LQEAKAKADAQFDSGFANNLGQLLPLGKNAF
jgi:hypothetical protein